uniref:Outer membrane protein beta-barrel domain-containing protein n=1 Tax=Rhodopseudomonas palustris (strain BisA53) TaxID=316055 RepID=Q07IZ3_RHOP5
MRSVKYLLAAGAASLLTTTAVFAADMPSIMPPPAYAPPPVEDFGGWYLRGDIGFSNQKVKELRNVEPALYPAGLALTQEASFDTAGIYGLGVGYQFNNWFRADVIGQYRGNSNFKGLDTFTLGANTGYNLYGGSKSEWLAMANAYVDLGTWWCITPFIGAGVGAARVTVANFTDIGQYSAGAPSWVSAATASKWNFAWAAHAGLAYKVSPGLTLELAYSYLNLGDGFTGDAVPYNGANLYANNPYKFKDITSHDLKLGVRWNLDSPPAYAPPLMRKG